MASPRPAERSEIRSGSLQAKVVTEGMIEGIASYASSASRTQLAAESNIKLAKKSLDQQKVEGRQAVALIESSGSVARQAPPTGDHTGQRVNVHA